MTTTYRSAISPFIAIPTAVLLGGTTVLLALESFWPALMLMFINVFIGHMFLTTSYTVQDQYLHIKCGFLYHKTIDIQSVSKISETNNPISSPAISLDRLEIVYEKNKHVLISPKEKKSFIDHVTRLHPGITVKLKKKS